MKIKWDTTLACLNLNSKNYFKESGIESSEIVCLQYLNRGAVHLKTVGVRPL